MVIFWMRDQVSCAHTLLFLTGHQPADFNQIKSLCRRTHYQSGAVHTTVDRATQRICIWISFRQQTKTRDIPVCEKHFLYCHCLSLHKFTKVAFSGYSTILYLNENGMMVVGALKHLLDIALQLIA